MPLALNDVKVTGRITHPLKLTVINDMKVVNFQIANDASYSKRDETAENGRVKVERTFFLPCKLYGPKAEALVRLAPEGKLLYFEGQVETDEWTDKETGEIRHPIFIKVYDWQFVEKKPTDGK